MSVCSYSLEQFKDGKIAFSDDSYKIKINAKKDTGEVNFNIVLTKVDDGTTCVEFHKKEGNLMTFYSLIDGFKKAIPSETPITIEETAKSLSDPLDNSEASTDCTEKNEE